MLQQHGLPQHAIAAVAELVVKLVAEGPPGPQQRQDGQQQPDQRQQQHAAQQQQAAACGAPQQPRDLRQADAVLQAVPFISPRCCCCWRQQHAPDERVDACAGSSSH